MLGRKYGPRFDSEGNVTGVITAAARFALETISKSDAPYHNLDHTILVTLAGQAIIDGLRVVGGEIGKAGWGNFTSALLLHDIGYAKRICSGDRAGWVATGKGGEMMKLPRNSTSAALSPYHVDRGKKFVTEQFAERFDPRGLLSPWAICSYIEATRFPFSHEGSGDFDHLTNLVRAADLIGQLGDPERSDKYVALFQEFEETGLNRELGYRSPEDVSDSLADFYGKMVHPHIQQALGYLEQTEEGSQWIAGLRSNLARNRPSGERSPERQK